MLHVPPRLPRVLLASFKRRRLIVTRGGREEGEVAEHVSRKPALSAGDDASRQFEGVVHGYIDSDASERCHEMGRVTKEGYARTGVR